MKLYSPQPKDVHHKTVLVRVDYNVPLKKQGTDYQVEDDRRIKASLPTIKFLQQNEAKIVLMSHLGRPGGKKEAKFSLGSVATYMNQELGLPVEFMADCVGQKVRSQVEQLQSGQILLLENTRFHQGEKKNDSQFAQELASVAEVFINDAFSSSHRQHASTVGVTKYLPSFAGLQLQEEVSVLHQLMTQPQRPFIAVIGGAKISDKIAALEKLLQVADAVLVGGGVANNFLKAEGIEVYKSYLQDVPTDLTKEGVDYVQLADQLIEDTKNEKILKDGYVPLPKILYPIDVVAAEAPESTQTQVVDLINQDQQLTTLNDDLMYLDIGPKTTRLFQELIKQAQTVFWNGPLGYFEQTAFRQGTAQVAQAIAQAQATTLIGGGDTLSAVKLVSQEKGENLFDDYSYVSTAGGASLAYLAGEKMPALEPLRSH